MQAFQFAISSNDAKWKAAASLESVPADLPWDNFPVAHALTVFARAMGSARTMELADTRGHVSELESLRDRTNNAYWSRQIEVLRREAAAWLAQADGHSDTALRLLESAVELEESMEKDPVTPGPVLPAREQLESFSLRWGDLPKASPLSSRLSPLRRIDSTLSTGQV